MDDYIPAGSKLYRFFQVYDLQTRAKDVAAFQAAFDDGYERVEDILNLKEDEWRGQKAILRRLQDQAKKFLNQKQVEVIINTTRKEVLMLSPLHHLGHVREMLAEKLSGHTFSFISRDARIKRTEEDMWPVFPIVFADNGDCVPLGVVFDETGSLSPIPSSTPVPKETESISGFVPSESTSDVASQSLTRGSKVVTRTPDASGIPVAGDVEVSLTSAGVNFEVIEQAPKNGQLVRAERMRVGGKKAEEGDVHLLVLVANQPKNYEVWCRSLIGHLADSKLPGCSVSNDDMCSKHEKACSLYQREGFWGLISRREAGSLDFPLTVLLDRALLDYSDSGGYYMMRQKRIYALPRFDEYLRHPGRFVEIDSSALDGEPHRTSKRKPATGAAQASNEAPADAGVGRPHGKGPAQLEDDIRPPQPLRGDHSVDYFKYNAGHVVQEPEGQHVEFKSLAHCPPEKIPKVFIERACKFVCAVLNARDVNATSSTLYFGIADDTEQEGMYRKGEVTGVYCPDDMVEQLNRDCVPFVCANVCGKLDTSKTAEKMVVLTPVPVLRGTREPMSSCQKVLELRITPSWHALLDEVMCYKVLVKKGGGGSDPTDFGPVKAGWNWRDVYELGTKKEHVLVAKRKGSMSDSLHDAADVLALANELKRCYQGVTSDNRRKQESAPASRKESPVMKRIAVAVEKFRPLNSYVLFASRLSSEYACLGMIDWRAVLDFDYQSEASGLRSAVSKSERDIKEYEVESAFGNLAPMDLRKTLQAGNSTHWIFVNGRDGTQPPQPFAKWDRGGLVQLERCLPALGDSEQIADCFKRSILVFLWTDDECFEHMQHVVFLLRRYELVVLVPDRNHARKVCEALRAVVPDFDNRKMVYSGFSPTDLSATIDELVSRLHQPTRATCTIPSTAGAKIPLPQEIRSSWVDLDIPPSEDVPEESATVTEARNRFYQGYPATWIDFMYHHAVKRDQLSAMERDVRSKAEEISRNATTNEAVITVVNVYHYAGTGGTTLGRHIIWNMRTDYRCAEIVRRDDETARQLHQFRTYCEPSGVPLLPLILLWDRPRQNDLGKLLTALRTGSFVSCVVVCIQPLSWAPDMYLSEVDIEKADMNNNMTVRRRLVGAEIDDFHAKIYKLQQDGVELQGGLLSARSLKAGDHIILFGLLAFGEQFNGEQLDDFVKRQLEGLSAVEVDVLLFCSLVDLFLGVPVPYKAFDHFLSPHIGRLCTESVIRKGKKTFVVPLGRPEDYIFESGASLLLSDQDSDGQQGWRPAHKSIGARILKLSGATYHAVTERFLTTMVRGADDSVISIKIQEMAMRLVGGKRESLSPMDESEDDEDLDDEFDDNKRQVDVTEKFTTLVNTIGTESGDKDACAQNQLSVLKLACKVIKHQQAHVLHRLALFYTHILSDTTDARAIIKEAIALKDEDFRFYTTLGQIINKEISKLKRNPSALQVIRLTREATEAFTEAEKRNPSNPYAFVDEARCLVTMLRLLKKDEFFQNKIDTRPDALCKFGANLMAGPKSCGEEESRFVRAALNTIEDKLQYIFSRGDVVLDARYANRRDEDCRKWRRSKKDARLIQADFYVVTGLCETEENRQNHPALWWLVKNKTTEYEKGWSFPKKAYVKVHALLEVKASQPGVCLTRQEMIVFLRSSFALNRPCLALMQERAKAWCARSHHPRHHALFFTYMLHFPIDNSPASSEGAKVARDALRELVSEWRERTGSDHQQFLRKAPTRFSPKFFVGTQSGLAAFVEAPQRRVKNDDDFWRSPEVQQQFRRFKGVKIGPASVQYREFEIQFDATNYPSTSQDKVTFYLAFTMGGPYAFYLQKARGGGSRDAVCEPAEAKSDSAVIESSEISTADSTPRWQAPPREGRMEDVWDVVLSRLEGDPSRAKSGTGPKAGTGSKAGTGPKEGTGPKASPGSKAASPAKIGAVAGSASPVVVSSADFGPPPASLKTPSVRGGVPAGVSSVRPPPVSVPTASTALPDDWEEVYRKDGQPLFLHRSTGIVHQHAPPRSEDTPSPPAVHAKYEYPDEPEGPLHTLPLASEEWIPPEAGGPSIAFENDATMHDHGHRASLGAELTGSGSRGRGIRRLHPNVRLREDTNTRTASDAQ